MMASAFDQEQLARVYEEEGKYASADALLTFARRRGLHVSRQDVRNFLAQRPSNREVYTIPKQDGKAFARREGSEIKVDLMDRSRRPARDGSKYILVAQDAFTRELHAEPIPAKTPAATAPAMARILARMRVEPESVLTDLGGEWKGRFEELLDQHGITLKDKHPQDYGAFASLDRGIRTIKKNIQLRQDDGQPWNEAVRPAVAQFNRTPNQTTGTAPKEVHESDAARFFIGQQMAQNWEHNQRVRARRERALEAAGGFRAQLPKPKTGWREDDPRYGPRQPLLGDPGLRFMFGRAHNEDGESVLLKRTLPSRI